VEAPEQLESLSICSRESRLSLLYFNLACIKTVCKAISKLLKASFSQLGTSPD
jgi:hypothetical protein